MTSPVLPVAAPSGRLPALALSLNALIWGTSWWPFRQLLGLGVHPLWATVFVFAVSFSVIVALRPRALGQLVRSPALWVLLAAAGLTNAAFNWAVVIGDVVRVVLLFYLMPLWSVLLARLLLHERLTTQALLRMALALLGAAIVLWPEGAGLGGLPLPREPADWLALLGGFTFALNTVMLKRAADLPQEGRALAMFAGGLLVPLALVSVLALQGLVPWPPAPAPHWLFGVGVLSLLFLIGNLALQYGAQRLPASVTSVVMLTEVLFASVSALLFGDSLLSPRLALGGACILAAALLAAQSPRSGH